ncbi:UBX domain-containing protein 1-like [Ruditapes philippinarum]|uniref:UBX domain-containing protein 1-like n=1 Tax=Ruditapes philippinarum TaxID=129788 RepID=UPI00295BD140|nr:UBX domain-containing protein 1-like [Ruditapes philippinarum]
MSEQMINSLLEMGFPQNRAEKALAKTQFQGVQQAMEWLFAHEEDADIDVPMAEPQGHTLGSTSTEPEPEAMDSASTEPKPEVVEADGTAGGDNETQPPLEAKSFKCDECGKLLKDEDAVQFHAAKTQHASFSESVDEVKPLSQEEKQEQLRKLQEKLKQKRLEREAEERKEAIQREKQRRTFGKDVVASKEKLAEIEMKKIAEQRRRDKMEEKMARQKVKEQIEKDKRERAAKFAKQNQESTPASTSTPQASTSPTPPAASAPAEKKDYTETRLQIRLTNGQALTQTFKAKEPLAAVRLYIEMNRTDSKGNFSLMTSFPRKVFAGEDYEKPLTELGLVPSAVLIVTKSQ